MNTATIFHQPTSFVSALMSAIDRLFAGSSARYTMAAGRVMITDFPERPEVTQRRAEAKAKLGPSYVLHPEYVSNPRHSNHIGIWWPNRTLKSVER